MKKDDRTLDWLLLEVRAVDVDHIVELDLRAKCKISIQSKQKPTE
jgi:hypothetical protein